MRSCQVGDFEKQTPFSKDNELLDMFECMVSTDSSKLLEQATSKYNFDFVLEKPAESVSGNILEGVSSRTRQNTFEWSRENNYVKYQIEDMPIQVQTKPRLTVNEMKVSRFSEIDSFPRASLFQNSELTASTCMSSTVFSKQMSGTMNSSSIFSGLRDSSKFEDLPAQNSEVIFQSRLTVGNECDLSRDVGNEFDIQRVASEQIQTKRQTELIRAIKTDFILQKQTTSNVEIQSHLHKRNESNQSGSSQEGSGRKRELISRAELNPSNQDDCNPFVTEENKEIEDEDLGNCDVEDMGVDHIKELKPSSQIHRVGLQTKQSMK